MQYRREIDGLRAIAVVPVILFHAGFKVFSGGYVGVDVFFVISGYLITNILLSDLERSDFSITRFYERRARRILPALFFVMLACMPFAYLWMLPRELRDFGQSIVSVIFFVSNFLFWWEDDYFSGAAELKPLLHTWSLAVEEQYYLIFPVFLFLTRRLARSKVFWIIVILALLSLALTEWGWRHQKTANFYLAPSRAWELLAGSICAYLSVDRPQRSNNILSSLGLALILASVLFYSETTPFPSLYALAPVLGTVLIILFASSVTWTARLLSTAPFVGIGLISYSAYLWHQPIFAFARLRSLTEPSLGLMLGLSAVSLVLAWMSWRYIERPFRNQETSILASRAKVFVASGIAGLMFILVGAAGHVSDGMSARYIEGVSFADLDVRMQPNRGLSPTCSKQFETSPACMTSDTPKVLVWGDSFAMHLVDGLIASAPDIALQQHTVNSCGPIPGIVQAGVGQTARWARKCLKFNDQVLAWLREHDSVDLVVLSSPFQPLLNSPLMTAEGNLVPMEHTMDVASAKLREVVAMIREAGARVLVVSPTPRSGWDLGHCITRSKMFGLEDDLCDFSLDKDRDAYRFLLNVEDVVPIYWIYEDICDEEGMCHPIMGETLIYQDGGHLTVEGSRYIGERNEWAKRFSERAY